MIASPDVERGGTMGILGHGIYTLPEAARLTHLKPRRVREWFGGRANGRASTPVLDGDYPAVDGDRAISFHDLIELFVAGQLRDRGVSLRNLRTVHEGLQAQLRTKHPFCRREILTRDGQVFTLGLDERGQEEMIEVLRRQRVFPDILLPFRHRIDYDEATEMAKRWCIADQVVIDPEICLGKPTVAGIGMTTAVLAAAYQANGHDAELVADWFRVHPKHVLAAVDFERSLAA
jgi:uncharacterized protein (DUF433 family)